jgi:hypothetical protein
MRRAVAPAWCVTATYRRFALTAAYLPGAASSSPECHVKRRGSPPASRNDEHRASAIGVTQGQPIRERLRSGIGLAVLAHRLRARNSAAVR